MVAVVTRKGTERGDRVKTDAPFYDYNLRCANGPNGEMKA